jgi:hypothetical protein
MTTLNANVATPPRRHIGKRAVAAATVGVGSLVVPAGLTFAQTPQDDAELAAGTAITGIAADAAGFTVTYVFPAIAVALGIGMAVTLLIKFGKRVPKMLG